MFGKQLVIMDKVRPFVVSDFILRDARTVTKEVRLQVGWSVLEEDIDRIKPGTVLCTNDMTALNEYMNKFREYEKNNPGKTTDDFDLIYDPQWDDSQCDPRLGTISLVVFQRRGPVGLINLYNIKTESNTSRKQTISAMMMPSLDTSRGKQQPEDVRVLLKGLLEKDLTFESGKILDIIEWRFPTRRSHTWTINDQVWSPVQDLVDDGHSGEFKLREGKPIPKSVRRR